MGSVEVPVRTGETLAEERSSLKTPKTHFYSGVQSESERKRYRKEEPTL